MTEDPDDKPTDVPGVAERLREAGRRGREELTRKGSIPDHAHGFFRRWLRKVWEARGGGVYAIGFAIAFLYFEITDILFDDIPKLARIDFFSADIVQFAIEFVVDTLINTGYAFAWPVWVVQWQEPWGLGLLIAAFVLFPRYLKKPMELWLFEGKEPPPRKKKKPKRDSS